MSLGCPQKDFAVHYLIIFSMVSKKIGKRGADFLNFSNLNKIMMKVDFSARLILHQGKTNIMIIRHGSHTLF